MRACRASREHRGGSAGDVVRDRLAEQLEAIRAALPLRASDPAAKALVRKTLTGKAGLPIAVIVDALDESDDGLLRLLPAAFATLMDDPVKRDPGCRGKAAIARAIDRTSSGLDAEAVATLERGSGHVQPEPVWGGTVDTAAELRGVCVMALVHLRAERALVRAAVLLADPEPRARMAAARAVAASGDRVVGEPLLRLKIAAGDVEAEVLGECFAALLDLVGGEALALVGAYLRNRDAAIAEAAALALGGSRLQGAFAILREADDSLVGGAGRRVRLLGIALLRDPAAWQYLLARICDGAQAEAEDAAAALATFRHDHELVAAIRGAVAGRRDRALAERVDAMLRE